MLELWTSPSKELTVFLFCLFTNISVVCLLIFSHRVNIFSNVYGVCKIIYSSLLIEASNVINHKRLIKDKLCTCFSGNNKYMKDETICILISNKANIMNVIINVYNLVKMWLSACLQKGELMLMINLRYCSFGA